MKLTIIFLLCYLITSFFYISNCQAGKPTGEICKVSSYPYMVGIQGTAYCGGTLLTMSYILTAGHCVATNNALIVSGFLRGFAGCDNCFSKEYAAAIEKKYFRYINWSKMHPDYKHRGKVPDFRNDIGIFRTAKPFEASPSIKPVMLYAKYVDSTCNEFLAMGWGQVQESLNTVGNVFFALRCGRLTKMSLDACGNFWMKQRGGYQLMNVANLCTAYKDGGKDICRGDAGGPLLCNSAQLGIISGRPLDSCSSVDSPAVYTRVDSKFDFIKRETGLKFNTVSKTGGNELVMVDYVPPSPMPKNMKKSSANHHRIDLWIFILAIILLY